MLDQLNPPQKEAVEHRDGPLLILAGAGSGKTRVITSRIAHLIVEEGVDPQEIVAVTFTNRAADEMRERVEELLGRAGRADIAGDVTLSTFHSLGAKLLRWHGRLLGLDWNFTILDADDQKALVKEVAERVGLDADRSERKRLRRYIERMKNRGYDPRQAHEQTRDQTGEQDAEFYEAYQKLVRETNSADFGDLLLGVLEIFRSEPDLAESYSMQWQYVMVDEFQDTNPAQYELLRHLTAAHNNLAVVGDDDQSIYRWRDATVANILDFEKDYPKTNVVKLEQNYRSTQLILDAAYDVIKHNPARREKQLWTDEEGGAEITCFTAQSGREEAEYVADEIQSRVSKGADYSDFAVFYRMNAQSRLFEEKLRGAGITYRVVGGTGFYERAEVKDVLAYLQLALNPDDDISLLRIIGTPTRGVGDKTVEKLREAAQVPGLGSLLAAARYAAGRTDQMGVGMPRLEPKATSPAHYEALEAVEGLGGRPKGGIRDFCDLMIELREGMLQEESMADLVKFLLDQVSYFEWLEDREPERAEDKKRNLVELMEAMRDFEREQADEEVAGAPVDFDGGPEADDLVADSQIGVLLRQFLEQSSLVRDADEEETGETVTLMTVHGAKGLEFDTVFLVGMEENLFPNVRDSDDKEELYEERRLAYVAITRAEEKLFITNARRRRLWGNLMRTEPSRFLLDIDEERIDFDPRSSAQEIDYGTKPRPWRQTGSSYGSSRSYGRSSSGGSSWDQSGGSNDEDFAQTYGEAVQGAVDGSNEDEYFSQVDPNEEASEAEESSASSASVGKKSGDELVGATVTHSRFGIGEVLSVSARNNRTRLTINFPKVGEKTVVRDFVKVLG